MSGRRHAPLLLMARALAALQRQPPQVDLARRACSPGALLLLSGPAPPSAPPDRRRPLPMPMPTTPSPAHHRWFASSPPPPEQPKGGGGEAAKEEEESEKKKEEEEAAEDNKKDDDAKDDDAADDDEESEHRIHALAAGGGPMRANLEAWLVAACVEGTSPGAPAGGQGGRTSRRGCTFLTLAPRAQRAPLVWAQSLFASLTAPMRRALQSRGEALVQHGIERDFSAADFCEGCAGAFAQVMALYGRGRWDLLAGMASPAVVRSMRAAWDDLRASKGMEPVSVTARASRVSLAAPNVWRRAAVARLDPERAAAGGGGGGGGGTVPWWAAVAVEVEAQVDVALGPAGWRGDGAARARRRGGGDAEGEGEDAEDDEEEPPVAAILERSSTRRVGYLVFARGPLPRSPAPALYSPWWLIGWY